MTLVTNKLIRTLQFLVPLDLPPISLFNTDDTKAVDCAEIKIRGRSQNIENEKVS